MLKGKWRRGALRGLVGVTVVTAFVEGVTACVGDEPATTSSTNNGDGGGSDGSNPIGDGSPGDDSGTAKAVTGDQTLYVGHAAVLLSDASTPSNGTFSWTITSVPPGSAITTASLQNATTPQPSFTPDIPGDYVVGLKLTAGGGATSGTTATVHAAPGKAFYVLSQAAGANVSIEIHYVRTDGTGDVAITCPLVKTSSTGFEASEGMSKASGVNWIEGAPGDDPHVVFGYSDDLPDGGTVTYIATGLGSSRCDGLHLVGHADAIPGSNALPTSLQLSPDATRVSYLPSDGVDPAILATIGVDGSNKHSSFGPLGVTDAGAVRFVSSIAPPRWIDTTHLAWVEYVGSQSWRVMTSADVVSPSPTLYMTCNATAVTFGFGGNAQPSINEFDILPNGNIIADVQGAADAGSSTQSIVVLQPQATGEHLCQVVTQLTNNAVSSLDYALSPDKTKIAFLGSDDGGNSFSLYVVPVDGSTAPVRVAGSPDGGAEEGHGPHWSADGAWLVWGASATSLNALGLDAAVSAENVVGIAASGGKISTIAMPDASTTSAYAVGNCCTIGSSRSSNDVAFAGLAAFIGLAVRRRKNRKNQA
jgi:hypothetical protein